jgi:CubicO group peptidase (beta-lactamase class C family)
MPTPTASPSKVRAKTDPSAAAPDAIEKALDALIAPHARSDAPGLVIGVAHRGRVLLRRGAGMASLEHAVANTATTRMRIGSASKQFTCLAVLLLAEDGRLAIDDPLDRHVPELPYPLGVPTLRQLMTHTGGMRCHIDVASVAAGLEIQPRGTAMATMKRQAGANYAPGAAQIYCNSGYHLLSVVVERVSGLPFERFLEERILRPLGLRETESLPSDFLLRDGMATLHVPHPDGTPGRWQRGIFVSHEVRGEGGMISTVDDMLTWLAHLRGTSRRVGSEATWQAMLAPAALDNGLQLPYALGLFIARHRGLDLAYHTGAVVGGTAQILTVPAHALDIAIMTNGAAVNPAALAKQVIDVVLAEHVRGPATPKLATLRRFAHLDGTRWRDDDGHVVGFAKVGDQIGISYLFSPPGPLLRDEGRTLRVAAEDAGLGPFEFAVDELRADASGKPPRQITLTDCGRPIRLRRVPARAPSVAAMAARLAGRWRSDELDADAVIAIENDALVLRLAGSHGHAIVDLTPVADDLLRMAWRGERPQTTGSLLVDRDGLRIHTFRTRGVRLTRAADAT